MVGWSGRAALVAGLLLALTSGYDLATPQAPHLAVDLVGLAISGLLLTYCLPSFQDKAPAASAANTEKTHSRRWGYALLGLGCLLGIAASTQLWVNQADWKPALPVWALGLSGVVAGAFLVDRRPSVLSRPKADARTWLALMLAVGLGCLTLFLRLYRLDQVPPGIFIDETNSAMDAVSILWGARSSPFGTGWYETPMGYIYLQAGLIALLGPTLLALKLPAIIAGVLTVLGVFFLGRLLFGTLAGSLAALFLAYAEWPLNMSRWGWNEAAPPFIHLWAVYFLVKGTRTKRAFHFALAGLILGLGMYSYLSIRLVVVAIAVYLAYRTIVDRGFLRQNLRGLALSGLVWALTFAPLGVTYANNPRLLFNRTAEVSIQRDIEQAGGKLDPLVENMRRHLLMFNVEGDHNPRHNLPGKPMLDPLMGALFLIALVRSVALGLDHRRGLLLLWIPVVLAGGVLSALSEGPQGYRTLGVMPAVVLLCGDLLAGIGRQSAALLARSRFPRVAAFGLPTLVLAVLIGWSAWTSFKSYFVAFANDPRVYIAFTPLETAVAQELATAKDPDSYYLSPRLYYFSPPRYFMSPIFHLEPGRAPTSPFHLFPSPDELPLPAGGQKDLTLLWGTEWSGLFGVIGAVYPHATLEQIPSKAGGVLYERVTIPRQDLVEGRGLVAKLQGPNRSERQVTAVNPSVAPPGEYSRVEWVGSLFVPKSGPRAVRAEVGTLLLDGRPAADFAFLPKGFHRIVVAQTGEQSPSGLRLVWGEASGVPFQPVPQANLYPQVMDLTHGLLGSYYQGERWEGTPLFSRVDPLILFGWPDPEPVSGPFSVSWQGDIQIPETGRYVFLVESDDGARLWLDGRVAGESMKPDSGNFFEAPMALLAGRHAIRLDYFQRGGAKSISLRWIRPNQPGSLVPPDLLYPAVP